MRTHFSPYAGIGIASLAAGPVFLAALGLAALGSGVQTIVVEPGEVVGAIALLLPATAFGMIIAFLPNLAGTAAMLAFGRHHEAGQMPAMCALAGAALGGGATCRWAETAPLVTFAFAATGAICALICRARAYWPQR
jgi:hypothetical protein